MKTERLIALDLAHTGFTESYRIKTYHGIIDYARQHTSWKLLYNVWGFSLTNTFETYEDLVPLGVDGLLFSYWTPEKARRIRQTGIPSVSISNDTEDRPFPCVVSDDVEVGRMAAEHFLERGFHDFAFSGSDWVIWEVLRYKGFREVIERHGLKCHFFAYDPSISKEDAPIVERDLRAWLESLPKPVGIMGADDTRALQALEACQQLGLSVPKDIAIVGVDNNILVCDSLLPSLSSVEQNAERVGYEAAALLDRLIQEKETGNPLVVVPPKGVVTRMSTDVIAVQDEAVARALMYIREHIAEAFSINDIVERSGVSRSSLEKRFRNYLSNSIHDTVRAQRLKLAKSMMVQTKLSIKEIAFETGHRHAAHFCNSFKQLTGISPGEWRAQHEKGK